MIKLEFSWNLKSSAKYFIKSFLQQTFFSQWHPRHQHICKPQQRLMVIGGLVGLLIAQRFVLLIEISYFYSCWLVKDERNPFQFALFCIAYRLLIVLRLDAHICVCMYVCGMYVHVYISSICKVLLSPAYFHLYDCVKPNRIQESNRLSVNAENSEFSGTALRKTDYYYYCIEIKKSNSFNKTNKTK